MWLMSATGTQFSYLSTKIKNRVLFKYLIDEAVDMDNAIISMLHHYFAHHGLGEKVVHLHTDNCG